MDTSKPSGHAVRADGTLKDAYEIDWDDPDAENLDAPLHEGEDIEKSDGEGPASTSTAAPKLLKQSTLPKHNRRPMTAAIAVRIYTAAMTVTLSHSLSSWHSSS